MSELKSYRVSMRENPDEKFLTIFDCCAVDADDAETRAEQAHPGYQVVLITQLDDETPGEYVIYSPNEASLSNDVAGFWSNTDGWVDLESATRFTQSETQTLNLPMLSSQDACWITLESAAQFIGVQMQVSLDGGKTFLPAPQGVQVRYCRVAIPGEDGLGQLTLLAMPDRLDIDLWTTREDPLDHNIGSATQPIDEVIDLLVADNA